MSTSISYSSIVFNLISKVFNKTKNEVKQGTKRKRKDHTNSRTMIHNQLHFLRIKIHRFELGRTFLAFTKVCKHYMQSLCQHIRNDITKRFNALASQSAFSTNSIVNSKQIFPQSTTCSLRADTLAPQMSLN